MKLWWVLVSITFTVHLVADAQKRIAFFEEHIDFELSDRYFSVNGIFSFANQHSTAQAQSIIFPFATDTRFIDSIRIFNLTTFQAVEFKRLSNAVSFIVQVPAHDTVDLHLFYRQPAASQNNYIITSTQSWGEPLEKAVYTLTTPATTTISSFSYQPDSTVYSQGKRYYYWHKRNFMPEKDFQLIVNQ